MVSAKFSVVLIAVAVVLCAQLAASAKTAKKSSGSTGRSRSSSTGHSNTHHTTHLGGSHSSSNTHSNNQHRSSGGSDRRHSSDLGSAYSHYDTPSRTSGGTRRGSVSSSSQHGGSDNSHHDSSLSSVPEQRRGRGGHTTDGTSASRDAHTHKDHPTHTSHSTATKRPLRFNPKKLSTYQRRKLANKLTRKQRTQRRQLVRERALNLRRKAKSVEKKTTESKKGLLNALSKKLSAITKKDIDLGLIWAKLKNSTKECAEDSKDSILDFVTDTVGKSVFGECTEAEKYAKLQKDLDTAKETLSGLKNKEKAQLETCSSEDGALSILDRKNNPPKKPATEAPEPIVTKKESASVLDAAANTTKPENDDDFVFEDTLDIDEEDLFRRKRDVSGTATVGELVDECRETVRNNTLKWTVKLDKDIKALSEQAKEIDQDKVEDCWSANFGENLGKSGIDFVVSTLGCIATGGP